MQRKRDIETERKKNIETEGENKKEKGGKIQTKRERETEQMNFVLKQIWF